MSNGRHLPAQKKRGTLGLAGGVSGGVGVDLGAIPKRVPALTRSGVLLVPMKNEVVPPKPLHEPFALLGAFVPPPRSGLCVCLSVRNWGVSVHL